MISDHLRDDIDDHDGTDEYDPGSSSVIMTLGHHDSGDDYGVMT